MELSKEESTQAAQAPQRPRRHSRQVTLRHTVDGQEREVKVGGGAPITVQSMTTSKTHDVETSLAEIRQLAEAGADVVRVAVPRPEDAEALDAIVAGSPVPIVADIHFNHTYALRALEAGVAKVRINPGNIGKPEWEREVLRAAREQGRPDPDRRQRRLTRKGHPGQVRLPPPRGAWSRARCATPRSAIGRASRT